MTVKADFFYITEDFAKGCEGTHAPYKWVYLRSSPTLQQRTLENKTTRTNYYTTKIKDTTIDLKNKWKNPL